MIEALFSVLSKRFGQIESPLERIVFVQFLSTLAIGVLSCFFGLVAAYSALLGGAISLLPAYILLRRYNKLPVGDDSGLKQAVTAELVRLSLSVTLFIATFVLVERLNVLFFFGTFIGTQFIFLVVPVAQANRLRNRYRKGISS